MTHWTANDYSQLLVSSVANDRLGREADGCPMASYLLLRVYSSKSAYVMLLTSSAGCHSVSRDLRLALHMILRGCDFFRGTLSER